MARQPIPTLELSALRTVAAPVDTFVTPQRSRLLDVAQSLEGIDRGLQEWFLGRKQESDKLDKIRGEAAFYQGTKVEQAEGVRSGLLPAQYTPAFMEGYKQAEGNVAGGALREKFQEEFSAWQGKNEDGADFNTFFQDFLKRNVTSTDPLVLRGILPSLRALEENGRSQFISYKDGQVKANSLMAHVASASQAIDAEDSAGLAQQNGTDYGRLWGSIAERRKSFVESGGDPLKFDETMMDALALKVVEKRDPGLLKFFDQKVPGTDYTYGQTPYGSKLKAQTIENLETIARRAESDGAEAQRLADKKAADDAERSTVEALVANPVGELPPDLVAAGRKAIPDFDVKVAGWRKTLNEGVSDNKELLQVRSDIINGGGTKAVTDAFKRGVFKNVEDLNTAMTFAKGYEENSDRIKTVVTSPSANNYRTAIEQRTKGLSEFGEVIPGMTDEGFEAKYDFDRMLQEWALANPEAANDPIQREKAINDIGTVILGRMAPIEGALPGEQASTYNRPESANEQFRNPITDKGSTRAQLEGDIGTDGTAQPSAQPPGTDTQSADPDVEPFLRNLQPGQRATLESTAKAQGKTVEQLAGQLLDGDPKLRLQYDPGDTDLGEGDTRTAEMSPEIASKFIEEALGRQGAGMAGNAPAGPEGLKALIRKHEAGGNYNAVFGNSKSTVDLSQFSLDEILGQQQAARRAGKASTAIGAYQFIYKTLRGLKQSMGLTGSEKFTPELQDRMADMLLEGRGLSRYLSGQMSQRQFALRLSQEWASLPNPNTGRSYYAGDGLNASSVSPSAVFAAMGMGAYAGAVADVGAVADTGVVDRASSLATFTDAEMPAARSQGGSFNPISALRDNVQGFADNMRSFEQGMGQETKGRSAMPPQDIERNQRKRRKAKKPKG